MQATSPINSGRRPLHNYSSDDEYDLARKIAEDMRRQPELIRNQRHLTRKYWSCFRGDEAVSFLISAGYAKDAKDAVRIGNEMFEQGIFAHVFGDHVFKNEKLFYRFTVDGGSSGRRSIYSDNDSRTVGGNDDEFAWNGRIEQLNQEVYYKVESLGDMIHEQQAETLAELRNVKLKIDLMMHLVGVSVLYFVSILFPESQRLNYCMAVTIGATYLIFHKFHQGSDADQINQLKRLPVKINEDKPATHNAHRLEDLRKQLEEDKNFDSEIFTDAYLLIVLNQPSANEPGGMRTFNYALEKMQKCMSWRANFGCRELPCSADELESVPRLKHITEHESYLYWYGFDYLRRPILWVKPAQKDWNRMSEADVKCDLEYHAMMFECGLRKMLSGGQSQFTIIADCNGLGPSHFNLAIIKQLTSMMSEGYPDRVANIVILPAPIIARGFFKIVKPFLPANLLPKISICNLRAGKVHITTLMDVSLLPIELGGNNHGHLEVACSLGEQLKFQNQLKKKWD